MDRAQVKDMTDNIPSYKFRLQRFCNKVQEMVQLISDDPEVQLTQVHSHKGQQTLSGAVSEMLVKSSDMEEWTHS